MNFTLLYRSTVDIVPISAIDNNDKIKVDGDIEYYNCLGVNDRCNKNGMSYYLYPKINTLIARSYKQLPIPNCPKYIKDLKNKSQMVF